MSDETTKKVDQLLSSLRDPSKNTLESSNLLASLSATPQAEVDLLSLCQQPKIRKLILKLSSEQDIHADRLLAKRQQIYDSQKLKQFDIFMFQEMDRLILKQQEALCKAGLPFKPSLELQELQRQKWSLSILLNAIKN
jgi:hypothetical protein